MHFRSLLGPGGRPSHLAPVAVETRVVPAYALAGLAQLFTVTGLFLLLAPLRAAHVTTVAFYVFASAAGVAVAFQRPAFFLTGDYSFSRSQLRRIALLGAVTVVAELLFLTGLRAAGPVRALLLGNFLGPAWRALLRWALRICRGKSIEYATKGPESTSSSGWRGSTLIGAVAVAVCLLAPDVHLPANGSDFAAVTTNTTSTSTSTEIATGGAGISTLAPNFSSFLGTLFRRSILVAAATVRLAARNLSDNLAVDVGGTKRVLALTNTCAAAWLLPVVLAVHLFMPAVAKGEQEDNNRPAGPSMAWLIIVTTLAGLLWRVIPAYADRFTFKRLGRRTAAEIDLLVAIPTALFLTSRISYYKQHYAYFDVDSQKRPVFEAVMATPGALLALALLVMTTGDLLGREGTSSRGTLIGSRQDGLPLYRVHTMGHGESGLGSALGSLLLTRTFILRTLSAMWETSQSRQLVVVWVSTAVAVVTGTVALTATQGGGWLTLRRSSTLSPLLPLIYACAAVTCGLLASVATRVYHPQRRLPYGLARAGALVTVFNMLLLAAAFVECSLNTLTLAWGTSFGNTAATTSWTTPGTVSAAAAGLITTFSGLVILRHRHHRYGGKKNESGGTGNEINDQTGENSITGINGRFNGGPRGRRMPPPSPNFFKKSPVLQHLYTLLPDEIGLQSVYLHLFTTALSCISTLVLAFFDASGGALEALVRTGLIVIVALIFAAPIAQCAAAVLLLETPESLRRVLPDVLSRVRAIPGVTSVYGPHFWTHVPGSVHGSLRVQVATGAGAPPPETVRRRVAALITAIDVSELTVQVQAVPLIGQAGFYEQTAQDVKSV